jgi:hypothetical protein
MVIVVSDSRISVREEGTTRSIPPLHATAFLPDIFQASGFRFRKMGYEK